MKDYGTITSFERWLVSRQDASLFSAYRQGIAEAEERHGGEKKLLRDTLVKVVGSDDPAELAAMRATLQEAKQAGGDIEPIIFDAIDVLISTSSAPAAAPSSDEGAGTERVLTLLTDLVDAVEHAEFDTALEDSPWDRENVRQKLAAANKLLGRPVQ